MFERQSVGFGSCELLFNFFFKIFLTSLFFFGLSDLHPHFKKTKTKKSGLNRILSGQLSPPAVCAADAVHHRLTHNEAIYRVV